ncbi:MAG: hypothetical protein K0B81_00770 [Candidatus Cloacimonetes bacterium]|nr:hypothetical protein [Candidatus Cloacimonadota bacterium]
MQSLNNLMINDKLFMVLIILFAFVLTPILIHSLELSYIEKFHWIRETFEENDAGAQLIIEQKGHAEFQKHNEIYEERLQEVETLSEAVAIYREWLRFFRPWHHAVSINWEVVERELSDPVDPTGWERYEINEEDFVEYLSSLEEAGFEGVWISQPYTIGIIIHDDEYLGFVIDEGSTRWQKQHIKLRFTPPEQDGSTNGIWYMGDYSPFEFTSAELLGNNNLLLGRFNLKRSFPDYPVTEDDQQVSFHFELMNVNTPVFMELSDDTILLRFPSFLIEHKPVVDEFLVQHHEKIISTPNLIIDIRNNGGGSDMTYRNLLPYLYTNPIRAYGTEFLASPLNIIFMENQLANIPADQTELRELLTKKLAEFYDNIGEFVNLYDIEVFDIELEDKYPLPERIAVIINENVGSAAELFAFEARQSSKTKLFGRTTVGALDTADMISVDSPCGEISLSYCIARSLRLPEQVFDNIGIQPDIFIDRTVPDHKWIDYVKGILTYELEGEK